MLVASVSSILASVYCWFTPGVLFLLLNLVIGGIAFASVFTSRRHQPGRSDTGAYAGHYLARSLSRTSSVVLDRFRTFKLHGDEYLEIPDPTAAATEDADNAKVSSGNFVVRSLSRSSSIVLDGLRSSFYARRYGSGHIEDPTDVAAAAGYEVGDDGRGYSTVHSLARSISRSSSIVLDSLRSFNLHRSPPPDAAASGEIVDEGPLALGEPETESEEDEELHHLDRSLSDTHPTAGEMPRKLAVRMKKSASDNSAFAHFSKAEVEEVARGAEDVAEGDAYDQVDARADDFIKRFRQQLKLQRLQSILRYKETLNHGS
ncbi:uncharacterized protein LOC122007401 [Zingiber officinale]|uniref:DUF4408 domain-containing protein n=1 Tax=Zingiber officinale TaxID=94328 RepID=A0A8J5FQ57_ZINOF|nr:uncharacterized protein LOC122007401 [Zingiber officinale]KAG6488585.1 hypothetical protein ZIOFF_049832 [Zingiber officinale]